MNENFYEKYAWGVFLIIGVLALIGAIPHTFGINTDPALVHAISSQTMASERSVPKAAHPSTLR